jgi:hypothetical protein
VTDLQSTLDAIDEATAPTCGWCATTIGPDAPSDLFCGPGHQQLALEHGTMPLVGYREPSDLPQHVYNQVEESDPETTPLREHGQCTCPVCAVAHALGGELGETPVRVWAPHPDGWVEATTPPDGAVRIALHTSNPPTTPVDDDGTGYGRGALTPQGRLAVADRVQVGANEWVHSAQAHDCEVQWMAQGDRPMWVNPVDNPDAVGVELLDEAGAVVAYHYRPRWSAVIDTTLFESAVRYLHVRYDTYRRIDPRRYR